MFTSTYSGPGKPCRYCEHWLRWDASGAAVCGYGERVILNPSPGTGFAFWSRAPGSDDDLDHHEMIGEDCALRLIEHLARQK